MSLNTIIQDVVTRIATEVKANKTLLNGNAAGLAALTTTAKTNLVVAINELQAEIDAINATSIINDATLVTTTTWSSQKIADEIVAAIGALTAGAPGALDTLDELAQALGDDANFASTITTALSNRIRFDAAQALTGPQQAQAIANIGTVSSVDIGSTTTDLVALFDAGLL